MQNLKIWNYLSLPWAGFTLAFFIVFFFLAFSNEIDNSFLSNNYLADLFLNTVLLSFSSAALSALIAVPLAILVTFYKFPGHKFFSWGLSLSIAFPAYVYAFIFVGIFECSEDAIHSKALTSNQDFLVGLSLLVNRRCHNNYWGFQRNASVIYHSQLIDSESPILHFVLAVSY